MLKILGYALALVVILVGVAAWLIFSPPRSYVPVGGGWYSAQYSYNPIAESGRKPRFLVRGHLPFFRRDVAEDITDLRYLGDDCVVYTFVNRSDDELYAACGNHAPIFLDHVPGQDHRLISIDSDPLRLHEKTMSVAEVKRRARE
jgi:hypothetical protein